MDGKGNSLPEIKIEDPSAWPPPLKREFFPIYNIKKKFKIKKKKYRRLLERGEKTTNKQNVINVISIIGQ